MHLCVVLCATVFFVCLCVCVLLVRNGDSVSLGDILCVLCIFVSVNCCVSVCVCFGGAGGIVLFYLCFGVHVCVFVFG